MARPIAVEVARATEVAAATPLEPAAFQVRKCMAVTRPFRLTAVPVVGPPTRPLRASVPGRAGRVSSPLLKGRRVERAKFLAASLTPLRGVRPPLGASCRSVAAQTRTPRVGGATAFRAGREAAGRRRAPVAGTRTVGRCK